MQSRLMPLRSERRGQTAVVNAMVGVIVSLMIAIIIVYQLFASGAGPTDNQEDNKYDAAARAAYDNMRNMAWVGIGLMSLVIIVLAAMTIQAVVQSRGGGRP